MKKGRRKGMTYQHLTEFLGGIVSLVFGLHTIVTKRATLSDENDEPHLWIYGWRAIAIGCLGLVAAVGFFASAAGMINWEDVI